MGNRTGYNRQVAVLQVWAIVLVCLGHSLFNPYATLYLHRWIYAFHMPLFMFVSGYLLVYAQSSRNRKIEDIGWFGKEHFFWKKVKRLLIPYVFISTLTYVPKYFLSAYALRPVDLSFRSYIHMLLYPWDNVIKFFWFLPTLFLITMLTVVLVKVLRMGNKSMAAYGAVFMVLLFLKEFNPLEGVKFLNLEGVVGYWLFFWSGITFYFIQGNVERSLRLGRVWVCALLAGIFSALIYYFPDAQLSFIRVAYTLLGILFSISLSRIYLKYHCRFIDHLFGSSYAIYLFSWFPLVVVQLLAERTGLSWQAGLVVALLVQIYIPFLAYKLIVRVKRAGKPGQWIAALLGQ